MSKYKSNFFLLITFVPAAIALFAYGYLGSFSRFLADDFCSVYFANRLGLLRSVWYWYLNWSGRYTAFGVDWVVAKLGVYSMSVIPPLALFIWLALTAITLNLSLRHVLSETQSRLASLSLAAIFLFTVLMLSPNIPQSLYWWNGMRSYSLPLILLTLYTILFQLGMDKLKTRKAIILGSFISFLFTFFNGGLGETYTAFQLALFTFLSALEWLIHKDTKSSRFIFLLAGVVGSVVSIVVVVASPGNAVRQGYFPMHPDFLTLIRVSIQSYWSFLLGIVITPKKILGLIGAFLAAVWMGSHSIHHSTGHAWPSIIILIGGFVLSFACFVPGVFATSEPPPTRTFTIPVFILIACILYTSFFLGQQSIKPTLANPLLIIATLSLIYATWINTQDLYSVRNDYTAFAQKWDQTNALILKAKASNLKTIQIPAMDNWANLERPTDNPKYWPNICYSTYYGIQVFAPPYP